MKVSEGKEVIALLTEDGFEIPGGPMLIVPKRKKKKDGVDNHTPT